jgi:methylthioribose-1-phosphate isomerase
MKYEVNDPVRLTDDGRAILAIDQTLLPGRVAYIRLETPEQMYDAIKTLQVRGAPCIGIFAAYAMFIQAKVFAQVSSDKEHFYQQLHQFAKYLSTARPTAMNLPWALKRMERTAANNMRRSFDTIIEALRKEADEIHENNIQTCYTIANYGLSLINDGDGIMTYCNAGALATSRYGTGLGPLILGAEKGMNFHAYVCETRPMLQGARLTTYELVGAGVDTTLICDNMAAQVMKENRVKACFVGADRVAKNGDTANKIGTLGLAVLAKFFRVPFYVFCPTSTIDISCDDGSKIVLEERDPDEIKKEYFKSPVAPEDVKCYNPSFDITHARFITAIITENGIFYPPFDFN